MIIPQQKIFKQKHIPLQNFKIIKKYYQKKIKVSRTEKSLRIYLNNKKLKQPVKIKKYYRKKQMIVIQKKRAINF